MCVEMYMHAHVELMCYTYMCMYFHVCIIIIFVHAFTQSSCTCPRTQALMFCHDRVSTEDYYLPRRHYPRIKQDPVDIILSSSVLNFEPAASSLNNSLPLSRDVPSTRKEDATIIYLQRTNRPLVSRC